MIQPLRNITFRWLFAAQVLSLLGVGLMTAALSLGAWRIGGAETAGPMLGLIFALKMIAYVGLAPLAEAALARVPRRRALIGLDLARLLLLLPMALVEGWGVIAALTFVFFAASAAFTPMFQALIPAILPEKSDYAQALALSRLAYTLETLLSPVLVGVALVLISSQFLFTLAALCFIGSVAALVRARIADQVQTGSRGRFWARATRGLHIYARTPRLRGLFLMNAGLSLAMAWILVNSVVYAGARLGDAEAYFPWLMGGLGVGSALMAPLVPLLLRRFSERSLIAAGGLGFALLTPVILLAPPVGGLVLLWAGFGAASTLVLTPGGLVLTRSAAEADRPAVFAAQFSLSHAGWLLAYPLAGWLGAALDPAIALVVLGAGCAVVVIAGLRAWPADDPAERVHAHPDLPSDHPHLAGDLAGDHAPTGGSVHKHEFHVDELHPSWDMEPLDADGTSRRKA
ncbi:MFS transporter [Pukyongiella litopenaei]|uniref:MFS transporter n=1 Tax=Pukyongiella litopenaei TaxID=2605946 RepID=A0A2S0MU24_9RHOB|nr:MFS transporter [Pukyongiella litopenaei]AVO39396.1 MFS transporter [Pukyongiella litopenaei]